MLLFYLTFIAIFFSLFSACLFRDIIVFRRSIYEATVIHSIPPFVSLSFSHEPAKYDDSLITRRLACHSYAILLLETAVAILT